MVLLAAGICTKDGKAIVSRQFIEMSRSRIEGFFAAFPKLQNAGKQHTFVETENVRYVYQPVEQLYVVLITNKSSNILEDLETLHLFGRVVPEYCRTLDEREISDKAFDLLFAFDEIVALGYRESVTLAQIKTYTEMDSHEEKMFQMVQKNKEKEAKEEMKRKMKELDRQKKEAAGGRRAVGMLGSFAGGFGSSLSSSSAGASAGAMSSTGFGGGPGTSEYNTGTAFMPAARDVAKPSGGKGLKLGGKKKMDEFVSALASEGQRVGEATGLASQVTRTPSLGAPTKMEAVHLRLEEKIVLSTMRNGGLQTMEVKGDLVVKITDPDKARLRIEVLLPDDKPFQYKTHPNINKQAFNEDCAIVLKDPQRSYPVNSDQGVLKYRLATNDDSFIPLSVNCWPSLNPNGTADVNIEYELEDTRLMLEQVTISIPVPSGAPRVGQCDGEYFYNNRERCLEWTVPLIDANSTSGSMEFSASVVDPGAFFPVEVFFVSSTTFSDVQISAVTTIDGAALPYSCETSFATESYSVV